MTVYRVFRMQPHQALLWTRRMRMRLAPTWISWGRPPNNSRKSPKILPKCQKSGEWCWAATRLWLPICEKSLQRRTRNSTWEPSFSCFCIATVWTSTGGRNWRSLRYASVGCSQMSRIFKSAWSYTRTWWRSTNMCRSITLKWFLKFATSLSPSLVRHVVAVNMPWRGKRTLRWLDICVIGCLLMVTPAPSYPSFDLLFFN